MTHRGMAYCGSFSQTKAKSTKKLLLLRSKRMKGEYSVRDKTATCCSIRRGGPRQHKSWRRM